MTWHGTVVLIDDLIGTGTGNVNLGKLKEP